MKKTIAQVLEEYRNRQNPQYEYIGVIDAVGKFERFSSPSNIEKVDGWLEFDTVCDCTTYCKDSTITTRHVRKLHGTIVSSSEIISDVKPE